MPHARSLPVALEVFSQPARISFGCVMTTEEPRAPGAGSQSSMSECPVTGSGGLRDANGLPSPGWATCRHLGHHQARSWHVATGCASAVEDEPARCLVLDLDGVAWCARGPGRVGGPLAGGRRRRHSRGEQRATFARSQVEGRGECGLAVWETREEDRIGAAQRCGLLLSAAPMSDRPRPVQVPTGVKSTVTSKTSPV